MSKSLCCCTLNICHTISCSFAVFKTTQTLYGSFKVSVRWVWGVLHLSMWIRCPLKRLGAGQSRDSRGTDALLHLTLRSAPICRVNAGNYRCARLFMNDSISSRLSRRCTTPKGEKAGRPRPRQTLQRSALFRRRRRSCRRRWPRTSDPNRADQLLPPQSSNEGRAAQGNGQSSEVWVKRRRRSRRRRRRRLDSWPLLELLIF